ncbi:rab3 GTPase-activating protein non-catalytic subunit [Chironomus tepperi]|uniref:rab3 GTPase-activating protein non-catalytic subunit n=1 Tax=Chironomus tepperi TaxID=113505 RepID=UPI00391F6EAE
MSCEININAIVNHLDDIQSFFGLNGITDKSWLNGIFMSYHSDTLCMGYGSKLTILSSYYDKEQQQKIYSNLKKITLEDENQIITNSLTFQVTGGSNYVDWTCIIIGLSTGVLQFYSDNGALLYEKNLNNEAVLNIRIIGDDLTIFYQSCIIVYQMSHLIPLLKSLKEMFNKAKTTKIDLMDKDYMVMYKKWDYKTKELLISDGLMIPQQKTCLFDHLVSEGLELGFTKKYRNTPIQSASVISTGSKPYINFHLAREGFKQQGVLTDVAKALANKITSRLPSWLTGSPQQQSSDKSEANEIISETLYPRHELVDYQRTGCNIYMSPINYQIAAVTDTLGRIVLIDIAKGIPIRMWKGYREAQCGFIEVNEGSKSRKENNEGRRCGLFLVIYAPRKAIIEIWCLQKGPKIATFQCSKHGFLLYDNHLTDSSHHHKSRHNKISCLFFDSHDNCLKTFSIPFHCILSEGNSKSAEDFHHLKRLKMTLKNINLNDEEAVQSGIIQNCEKIQMPEIKLKCLELMTNYKKIQPQILRDVIDVFESKMEEHVDVQEGDEELHEGEIQDEIYRNQLSASCDNYKKLIECYVLATSDCEGECLKNETIELMEPEYLTMQRLIELMNISKKNQSSTSKNVTFEDAKEKDESIVAFFGSFIVTEKDKILINTEHLDNHYDVIGSVLFTHVWKEKLPSSKLAKIFELINISSEEVMRCFLHFYLKQVTDFSNEDSVLADMTKFKVILDEVCSFAGDKVTYAYDSICIFWQDVREYLLESNNPINGLLAAILCKIYALKQVQNSDEASFEQVTQEECQWVLLTEKLNDVAVLSIFIRHFAGSQVQKGKYEMPSISLKKILNEGKGIISELVAQWLIHTNLSIDLLFKNSTDENLEPDERDVIKKLEILKIHFPYSLDPSIILSQLIWITMSHWSKNLSEIHYLKSSIEYLNLFKETEYHLKHGLCVMLWNGNFKIPLKATQKLINKTGRLPKEKLCLQNTMIPDFLIPQFLEQTLIFINHFQSSRNFNNLTFKCEEILQQGSASDQASLCELILQQAPGNSTLLTLHYEMVSILELIAFLNIKYTKPMQSLFDEMSNESFFMDINKPLTYNLQKADEIRQNTRIFFLKKAISCTIDLIVECQQSTYFDDHIKWIEKVKKVGHLWDLDGGLLDRHHVLELYVYGYDDLAGELFDKVSERERIIKQLLDISAKRLNLYLSNNRAGWKQVASGGALLTNYLETIHARKDDALLDNVRSSSTDNLYRLAYRIFEVASTSKNFSDPRALRLAGQLLDTSLLLKNES